MLDDASTKAGEHGDFVEFHTAGTAATGAFHCSGCGYGVTVQVALPRCPMCGGTTWEPAANRPVAYDSALQH
jgi:rubrerythrin